MDIFLEEKFSYTYETIERLYNHDDSPFYLLDVEKLRDNYKKLETAFKSKYEYFIIAYSYKTNYLPYLCKELYQLGAYAEVVSRLEYDLAVKIGVPPQKIIFNGPLKTEDDMREALNNGSIINIDSLYEIDYVKKHCINNKEKQFYIGIRLNFDIAKNNKNILQENMELSRFGICTTNGMLDNVFYELRKLHNLKIIGLHGHFSTKNRDAHTYRTITKNLCYYAKRYIKDDLQFIDVGGGIYGELPKTFNIQVPSFHEYADAICTVMNDEFKYYKKKPMLILEPGISMVANTFSFFTKVIEYKRIQNTHFILVDGSVHNVKPTMHKRNLPITFIRRQKKENKVNTFHIVGYTCMEKDYLASNINDLIPEVGDFVQFDNVGAYTIVLNPPFIKERPSIFAIDGGRVFPVRKKESFHHFFNEQLYYF